MELKFENDWGIELSKEFSKPYFKELISTLKKELELGIKVFPNENEILRAFQLAKLSKVKVVILGQDPYHGHNQANGLSFSVNEDQKLPPSLLNIYKEIEQEFNIKMNRQNGNLSSWSTQGVLLLNSILTVRANEPASHQTIGWQQFTDEVLRILNNQDRPIVFMLWGSYAVLKKKLLTNKHHLILETSHPSPLSAYRGFIGCNHFITTNRFLISQNQSPINWQIA